MVLVDFLMMGGEMGEVGGVGSIKGGLGSIKGDGGLWEMTRSELLAVQASNGKQSQLVVMDKGFDG